MSKKVIAMAALVLTSAFAYSGTFTWSAYYVYKPGGAKVAPADNYLAYLYIDDGDSIIEPISAGQDLPAENSSDALQDFLWSALYDGTVSGSWEGSNVVGGVDVFLRVFNASTYGDATAYVDCYIDNYPPDNGDAGIYSIPTIAWDTGVDSGCLFGGNLSDGSDWVAVPEPTTLGLFGMGALVLAFKRRFRR